MPQLPQVSIEIALIAGRAVFLVVCFMLAAIAFVRCRRAIETSAQRFAEQNTALLAQFANMEQSLAEAHRKLDALSEHREGESRRGVAGGTSAPSYQIAIRMARSGTPRDELMASCGLTRQEAELVLRLHAPAKALKSSAKVHLAAAS